MGEAVEPIRVIVADEHALFRQAVRIVLEREADLMSSPRRNRERCHLRSGASAPECGIAPCSASASWTAWQRRLRLRDIPPSCRVIVLTDEGDPQILHKAIEAGAAGYLTKDIQMSELTAGIRAVHRGDTLVPPNMLGGLFDGFFSRRREQSEALRLLSRLSSREQEVLALLVDGAGQRRDRSRPRDQSSHRQDAHPASHQEAGGAFAARSSDVGDPVRHRERPSSPRWRDDRRARSFDRLIDRRRQPSVYSTWSVGASEAPALNDSAVRFPTPLPVTMSTSDVPFHPGRSTISWSTGERSAVRCLGPRSADRGPCLRCPRHVRRSARTTRDAELGTGEGAGRVRGLALRS